MRKSILAVVLLLVAVAGCQSGSHLTFGPLHAESSVQAYTEWQEPTFYFAEEKEGKGLCTGSAWGFLGSEVCAGWLECNELSAGGYTNWDQSE